MAALVALENFASRNPSPETSAGQGTGSAVGLTGFARTYPEAIARLDAAIADGRARVAAGPDQWLLHEILARNYLAKARLSGSFDDFAAARSALARAFELAPPGSGPHLSQAALDFGMHRLNDSERQLALIDAYAIPPDPVERAEIAAMRGDLAFYRGDYRPRCARSNAPTRSLRARQPSAAPSTRPAWALLPRPSISSIAASANCSRRPRKCALTMNCSAASWTSSAAGSTTRLLISGAPTGSFPGIG
jgi:hypothetical protein